MPKPFADVSARTQVLRRLRELARTALPTWGRRDATLRLLFLGATPAFASAPPTAALRPAR
ncbi:MAG: hypothetical protein R2742_09265 [Micropruina glycogenica]